MKIHYSDCAVHNAPAYPPGPCDCGMLEIADPVEVEADAGDLIAECITEQYGERCPDFEPGCYCCQAWAQYDALRTAQARGEEGMREAAAVAVESLISEWREQSDLPPDAIERSAPLVGEFFNSVAQVVRELPLSDAPASQWRVKPLVWRYFDLKTEHGNGVWDANAPWTTYSIEFCDGQAFPYYCPKVSDQFETLEAAKAAAQADYERRILSALDLPTPPAKDEQDDEGSCYDPDQIRPRDYYERLGRKDEQA